MKLLRTCLIGLVALSTSFAFADTYEVDYSNISEIDCQEVLAQGTMFSVPEIVSICSPDEDGYTDINQIVGFLSNISTVENPQCTTGANSFILTAFGIRVIRSHVVNGEEQIKLIDEDLNASECDPDIL